MVGRSLTCPVNHFKNIQFHMLAFFYINQFWTLNFYSKLYIFDKLNENCVQIQQPTTGSITLYYRFWYYPTQEQSLHFYHETQHVISCLWFVATPWFGRIIYHSIKGWILINDWFLFDNVECYKRLFFF